MSEGAASIVPLTGCRFGPRCAFAEADAGRYRQYLLHCDPLERFSVVSFVWGPGQQTPVHDHTVWGMVGVLRGAEICEEFFSRATRGIVR